MKIKTNIVGLKHQNITLLALDTLLKYPIQLKREPTNKFDRNAVQCLSGSRILGYIEAKKSLQVSNLLVEAAKYEIKVLNFDSFKISIDLTLDLKSQDVQFTPLVDGDESGIYEISFEYENQKYAYIGQSVNINKRITQHINELSKFRHHNEFVQTAWIKNLNSFKYRVLKICPANLSSFEKQIYLFEKEIFYIENSTLPTANKIAADLVLSSDALEQLAGMVKEIKAFIKRKRALLVNNKKKKGQEIIDAGIIQAVKYEKQNITVQASNVLTWLNKTRFGVLDYKPRIDRTRPGYDLLVGSLKTIQQQIETVDRHKRFADEFLKTAVKREKFETVKFETVQTFLKIAHFYK